MRPESFKSAIDPTFTPKTKPKFNFPRNSSENTTTSNEEPT